MCSVILRQRRERRIGVIRQDLGALTTARASEFWMCCIEYKPHVDCHTPFSQPDATHTHVVAAYVALFAA